MLLANNLKMTPEIVADQASSMSDSAADAASALADKLTEAANKLKAVGSRFLGCCLRRAMLDACL